MNCYEANQIFFQLQNLGESKEPHWLMPEIPRLDMRLDPSSDVPLNSDWSKFILQNCKDVSKS
jgi:hypothetical protein